MFLFIRLRIAFKWLMRAFSGYLASNQLLSLWDRILAYDSLEILPGRSIFPLNVTVLMRLNIEVLAVAIFVLRKGNVFTVTSETAVEVNHHSIKNFSLGFNVFSLNTF